MADGKQKTVSLTEKQRTERVAEIRKLMSERDKHINDPYAYYIEEIDQVRAFQSTARSNIGFLLGEVERLQDPTQKRA